MKRAKEILGVFLTSLWFIWLCVWVPIIALGTAIYCLGVLATNGPEQAAKKWQMAWLLD